MEAVFKMYLDYGRMGDLEGVFIADKQAVEDLINSDQTIWFGEVLGKHSEVDCQASELDIQMISDDPAVVKIFRDNNIEIGYNPFDYID